MAGGTIVLRDVDRPVCVCVCVWLAHAQCVGPSGVVRRRGNRPIAAIESGASEAAGL